MRADALASFSFASRLTRAGRAELGALAAVRAPPARMLLRRGDAAGGAYLVIGGAIRVFAISTRGRESTLYRVEPGQTCVLALTATLEDTPYPAWAEADRAGAEAVLVPAATFRHLVDHEPAFRHFVLDALASRITQLMRELESHDSDALRVRLARYLVDEARSARTEGTTLRSTQAAIARELGTAREVVVRALHGFVLERLVRTGRGRVELLDLEALAAIGGRDASAR